MLSLALLILTLALLPLPALGAEPMPSTIEGLAPWLAQSEDAFGDIRQGTEKTILWATPDAPAQTPISIVYLHGFSATRQESSPLAETLAKGLGANLFYTRLRGHGRSGDAMVEGTRKAWKEDTLEALRIGQMLGERVVIMGLSTGSTLGTWLATEPEGQDVLAYVFLSPNWGIDAPGAGLVTLPGGRLLARIVVGKERDWTQSATPEQQLYWTTRYPSRCLVPLMRLVKETQRLDLGAITTPTLVLYSPEDQVISPQAVLEGFEELGAPNKALQPVTSSTDPSQHVLTGRVLSPGNLAEVEGYISAFLTPLIGL